VSSQDSQLVYHRLDLLPTDSNCVHFKQLATFSKTGFLRIFYASVFDCHTNFFCLGFMLAVICHCCNYLAILKAALQVLIVHVRLSVSSGFLIWKQKRAETSKYMYTVGHKKTWHFTFVHIFASHWPIFKILSLADSADNLQWCDYYIYHQMVNASLHYVVKYKCKQKLTMITKI